MLQIRVTVIGYGIIILSLAALTGCVSRYKPLDHLHPLSGECDDYSRFSDSILKQRDRGFTKRAAMNITGLSVGSEKKRQALYETYKPIFEIVYQEYQINSSGIRAAGLVMCEYQLQTTWPALVNEDYKAAAETIYLCQLANPAEPDIQRCILARARGKPDPELEQPPE